MIDDAATKAICLQQRGTRFVQSGGARADGNGRSGQVFPSCAWSPEETCERCWVRPTERVFIIAGDTGAIHLRGLPDADSVRHGSLGVYARGKWHMACVHFGYGRHLSRCLVHKPFCPLLVVTRIALFLCRDDPSALACGCCC